MIDDERPTPRPYQIEPWLHERLAQSDERPAQPGGRPARPDGPPGDAETLPPGTLGARLAGRRRLGGRPDPAVPTDTGPAVEPPADAARPSVPRPSLGPWRHVAGPADRASFFEEQARHRRATWQLSAMTVLVVVLAGLPLSLVVTPIVFLAIVLLTKLMSVIVMVPPAVPQLFRSVASWIGAIVTVIEASDAGPVTWALIWPALVGVVLLLAPGILLMLAFWLMLRRLFSGAGVGGLVIGLGARDPVPADLEERQLVNVVEEMAIAAGLPAPRVMLLDGQVANAAVVGSSPEDAVVIVSRRLLDEMDRDQTQGVLAHLIGAIGNGDLGAALSMVTVFRTFGLVNTLLDAPISSSARETLWQLWTVLHNRPDPAHPDAPGAALRVAEAARLLGSRVSMTEMEDVNLVLGDDEQKARAPRGVTGLLVKARVWALFPIWAAAGMAKTGLMVMIYALLAPLLAWIWQTRRFLADATAVQLTRNPGGIAEGLQGLLARGGGIKGGAWAEHLFVVGGSVTDQVRANEQLVAELQAEVERESAGTSGVERMAARLRAGDRYRRRLQAEAAAASPYDESEIGRLGWLSVHPSIQSRLKRLQKMGAHVDEAVFHSPRTGVQTALMWLVLSPLLALEAVLLGVVVVLSTGLVIVFMMIPLGIVYLVFESLF